MFTKTASGTKRGSPLELRLASMRSHTKQKSLGKADTTSTCTRFPFQDVRVCMCVCVCVCVCVGGKGEYVRARACLCVLLGGGPERRNREMLRPICRLNLQTIKPCGQIKVLCPEKFPKRGLSSAQ